MRVPWRSAFASTIGSACLLCACAVCGGRALAAQPDSAMAVDAPSMLPYPDTPRPGLLVEAGDAGYRVSGDLEAEPLAGVLESLSQETGFRLHLSPRLPEQRVTLSLDNTTLPEALDRLLASMEYAIGLDRNGKVSSVHLFSVGEAAPEPEVEDIKVPSPLDTAAVRELPPSIRSALEHSMRQPSAEEMIELERRRDELFAEFLERFDQPREAPTRVSTEPTTTNDYQR